MNAARQKALFWTVAIVCAVSRFAARARSLWDWDEALFCLGMVEYDVTSHHPHPPGFPVYIAMAKVARLFTGDDFGALQSLNLLAGMMVFPAVYLLAKQVGLRFETSLIAGALCAFFPNVWFFGGTGFSDVPSIVIAVFAAVFLFRGAESRRDYFIGTLLLALAIGIRPQNFLVGLFPGIVASARRPIRDVLAALVLGVVVAGLAFGAAVQATGTLDAFMTTVRGHSEYITRVDSFRSPNRPPLWRIFDRFFLKQYQSAGLSIVTSLLVIVSVAGSIRNRDRAMARNFLTFAPFAIAAWLMLDRFSISRFSIGYAPMFAIFAADGIRRTVERGRSRPHVELIAGGLLIAAFAIWTVPALTPVRNEISPTVRAVEAVKRSIDPSSETLFVGQSMGPFVEYLAPDLPFIRVIGASAVPLNPGPNPFLLAEVGKGAAQGEVWRRERGRLWNISRRHYFEIMLEPLTNTAQFGEGWYEPQRHRADEWRWMAGRSSMVLPRAAERRELRLEFTVPSEVLGATLTITLNGKAVDRVRLDNSNPALLYEVDPAPGTAPNRLDLVVDRTAEESGRRVSLKMRYLGWGAVR
jgi:4-amino-4-deoxy-L-arabinose transferase-like glycosyltransferase